MSYYEKGSNLTFLTSRISCISFFTIFYLCPSHLIGRRFRKIHKFLLSFKPMPFLPWLKAQNMVRRRTFLIPSVLGYILIPSFRCDQTLLLTLRKVYGGQSISVQSLYYFNTFTSFCSCIELINNKEKNMNMPPSKAYSYSYSRSGTFPSYLNRTERYYGDDTD